jgi:ubiquinone/menaquinone biosynthesis C-methylase UbiE
MEHIMQNDTMGPASSSRPSRHTLGGGTKSQPERLSAAAVTGSPSSVDFGAIKLRQKATWESGDFGQVAKVIRDAAEEFIGRLELRPGSRVLDVACGTGNLAVIAARRGCETFGLDIASNLIGQARERAKAEGLSIEYSEGDAEALPYADSSFDTVVSMYGVMFAPRPDWIVKELCRVTRPGGLIALANWTPEGFIGKMFKVFARHVPPPAGLSSPLLWGDEAVVRSRFNGAVESLRFERCIARMKVPFDPGGTVDFFRRYYGPTLRAFESLDAEKQVRLYQDLVELQTQHNVSTRRGETETAAEYLIIQARRRA